MSRDANAHFFAASYTLPIPFSLYAWGAAATLLVSFVLVALFARDSPRLTPASRIPSLTLNLDARLIAALQFLSFYVLVLTVLAGLVGDQRSATNFSMPFFWVGFVLGLTYVTAILGDVYSVINPWLAVCAWAERVRPGAFAARVPYPQRLAYWPACLLYFLFIWVELFGHTRPFSLALLLLCYSAITLTGVWVYGKESWLRYGEFFGVFFRIIAKLAPLTLSRDESGSVRWERSPWMTGLWRGPAEKSQSLAVFVVFMLSSTAFDGVHETSPWVSVFWKTIYPPIHPILATFSARPYILAPELFYVWQWLMLAVLAALYFGVYLLFIWLAKVAARSSEAVHVLALRFAFTLVPIAFVYHFTHYFTLLITESATLLRACSDPFGRGWDLLGLSDVALSPVIPPAAFVWHTQVWLIVAGHIVSVYLSHLQALRSFGDGRRATLSQIPILLLMVCLTSLGLWILSLPYAPVVPT